MFNRLLIAVVLFLVLSGSARADDPVGEIVYRNDRSVSIVPEAVDIRCDYAAAWFQLDPQRPIAPAATGATFDIWEESTGRTIAFEYKEYGHLDGVVRGAISDVLSTTYRKTLSERTRVRWSIVSWRWNTSLMRWQILGETNGVRACTEGSPSSERWSLKITRRGQPVDKASVTVYDGSAPWFTTQDGGQVQMVFSDDRGQSRYFLICSWEDPYHWVVRAGPFRASPGLTRNGVFNLEIPLDGLGGPSIFGGWCNSPIDWSRYN